MSVIDVGGQVRQGEELNITAIQDWLFQQGICLKGTPKITQYSGGASNWTYRIESDNHDLILRRPPSGTKAKSAHDMVREYRVQKALKPLYPMVPEMVALCTDHTLIGCDFYVMERIEGIILRADLPQDLSLSRDQLQSSLYKYAGFFNRLTSNSLIKGTDLEMLGKGEGYCRRQVEGWDKRYEKALTPDVPNFSAVRQWLYAHVPQDSKTCVIHNDWRFDNLILDRQQPTSIIGVLDWEMTTLGDPLMDLGCALAYWVQDDDNATLKSMRRQPTYLQGMFLRQEVVDYYLQKTVYKPTIGRFTKYLAYFV